ncbi:MAG: HipA N-terminal domain-containing protein [Deltaproteobacteria bacterium]|nr:HipA N-terminal domain-containing protein [Deltaproteobacteria bacterium]
MNQKGLRSANVYYQKELAGILEETERGVRFVYTEEFLKNGKPLSVSLPLNKEPFESEELFPFFQGILPEGWYLEIVCKTAKIDPRDKFGLLLATARADTIGAVTVQPNKT